MTILWELTFAGRIYHCTDDTGFGFLTPGDWVHGQVATVTSIDVARPISEPDVILESWSQTKLWIAWIAMALVAVMIPLAVPIRSPRQGSNSS
jgi:hypothetical protein